MDLDVWSRIKQGSSCYSSGAAPVTLKAPRRAKKHLPHHEAIKQRFPHLWIAGFRGTNQRMTMFERDYDHPNGPGRTRVCSSSFLTCGALAAVNMDGRETLALSVYVAISPSPQSLRTQNFAVSSSLPRRSPPDTH